MDSTFNLLIYFLQPITRKDIELQVVEIPSDIKLERPFSVILYPFRKTLFGSCYLGYCSLTVYIRNLPSVASSGCWTSFFALYLRTCHSSVYKVGDNNLIY